MTCHDVLTSFWASFLKGPVLSALPLLQNVGHTLFQLFACEIDNEDHHTCLYFHGVLIANVFPHDISAEMWVVLARLRF